MIELIVGTYGFLCWLVFKKFRLIPVNSYTVSTAIMIGVAFLAFLGLMMFKYHPASADGRLYTVTTPIVPSVAGRVIDVPVRPNVLLREGDVLFQIDPEPYQYEVARLEAKLAAANADLGQLEQRLAAAEAASAQARSEILASESEFDRQARRQLEQAQAAAGQVAAQLSFARKDFDRYKELVAKGTVPRQKFDQATEQVERLEAEQRQAAAAIAQAEEAIKGGGDKLQSAREKLRQAEAQEKEIRIALQAESNGSNPDIQQVVAELNLKRWELSETTARAPGDGYVTQLTLRPGQMASTLPIAPVMVFIHDAKPQLVASFPQNVIAEFKPGLEAELAFKAYPGKIFKATVRNVLPVIADGQASASGALRTTTPAAAPGRIPVLFDYGPDVEALGLPGGAQALVAVYTDNLHAVGFARKIILRIKSWENYIFLP
ncbi:HlyD family secretion protein [Dongia sp.]|uniref:HlyD family secretion protein n=1 Tax=Dongia sp. TaxID=1977262 RepID=UPI0035B03080